MKYFFGFILFATFILLLSTTGCVDKNKGQTGSDTIINQYDRHHQKQGHWEIYSDSILIAEGSYIDDQPDGLWVFYYPSGQKKEEGHYSAGEKGGVWVQWYTDGELMWKGLWENGKRKIEYTGEKSEIVFIGQNLPDQVLVQNTTYQVRIRIPNIPISHLFIEVSNGSLTRETDSDLFILSTAADSTLTMVIGYRPDLEFKDFRNLVEEIHFIIK